jgi:CheY-like chemotaxis protein
MRSAEWEKPLSNPQSTIRNPQSKRVLVVDDNVDAAETLADLLKLWGHQVWVAHDGKRGLEAARAHCPEVVLLDIGMPGMDGYEVARLLRKAEGERRKAKEEPPSTSPFALPLSPSKMLLVAVTGYGQAEDRQRAQAAGFDHHLTKPVEPEVVRALVAEA